MTPETHILGCCLVDGDNGATLSRAVADGITPEHFALPANRLIYTTLLRTRATDLALLGSELESQRQLAQVGGWPYLMELTAGIPTTAHYAHYRDKLREAHLARALDRLKAMLADRAKDDPATVLSDLAQQVRQLSVPSQGYEPRRITLGSQPTEPTTRLSLAGKPIATPGNLVTLISKAKTGKTATIGGVIAAIIAAHHDRQGLDTLGFTAPHTKEAVILIDTEQSPYDAFICHQRSFARAQQQTDLDWFCHYAMVGMDANSLREALPRILTTAKAAHGSVFTLILDGVADYVNSVNDEAECNGFISWLRALAVQYDCPIICVIHSNEAQKAGDDGRGHLGKQLTRKAESNLLLKKIGDTTQITSEKQRKAPITEADGIAFRWSDEHQRHVSCMALPDPKGAKGGRRRAHDITTFMEAIPKKGEPALTGSQLHRYAIQIAEIKPQTFKDLLNEAAVDGLLTRTYDKTLGYSYARAL